MSAALKSGVPMAFFILQTVGNSRLSHQAADIADHGLSRHHSPIRGREECNGASNVIAGDELTNRLTAHGGFESFIGGIPACSGAGDLGWQYRIYGDAIQIGRASCRVS